MLRAHNLIPNIACLLLPPNRMNYSCVRITTKLRLTLRRSPEKMKAVGITVSALQISFFAIAAASYFYNPDNMPSAGTVSVEEKFQTISKIYCAAKCSEVDCYEFWWNSGICNIRKPRTSQSCGKVALFRLKVCLVYYPGHFTVQSEAVCCRKELWL